jgi:hypothetical protein
MTHSCELEDFSGQVFEDGGNINCSLGSNTHLILGVVLQETLDTAAGELENWVLADISSLETRRFGKWRERSDSRSAAGCSICGQGLLIRGALQNSSSVALEWQFCKYFSMILDVAHRVFPQIQASQPSRSCLSV